MADLGIVKSNVAKMVSMGAPETDIDSYIQAEGSTVDAIKNFQTTPQPDSIATQGIGYIAQHPVKSVVQGLPETITGKSMADRAYDSSAKTPLTDIQKQDYQKNWNQPPDKFTELGVGDRFKAAGGMAVDMATSPLNVVGGLAGKPIAQALGKGLSSGVDSIKNFLNFDQRALTLGQQVRQVAGAAKQAAVDRFGGSLDGLAKANPNTSISLQQIVDDIKNNPDLPYEANSVFKRTPILRDMLKNPGDAGYVSPANVTLKDTQDIINYINTKVPKSIKANSLDILDVQNDLRAAQLDAFPQMAQTRAEYGKFAEDYKLVKSALNPKSTPGAIMSNFGGNIAVKDAAKRVLAPVIKDMTALRGQAATASWVKKIGLTGLGLEAAYQTGKRVLGK